MLIYLEALRIILERADFERGPRPPYVERIYRLDRVRELLGALGNPHRAYRTVHVAGTKGKGSTSSMIASILGASGYAVGLYTSPHLHTFRERMRIGQDLISEDELVRLVARMMPVLRERPEVTVFEIITALAMLFFAERGVGWAVFEVGLGGRLDATNVIEPEVSVISSISLDHTQVLGDTLDQIAREKAGIIKSGVSVISAAQPQEAMTVIEQVAKDHCAPLAVVGRDWQYTARSADALGQVLCIMRSVSDEPLYRDLHLPLMGEHQAENACLAVGAIETLRERGFSLVQDAVHQGLGNVRWPGRMEVLATEPLIVVDGAHNDDSMLRLFEGIQRHLGYKRVRVILGVGAGHQPAKLVDIAGRHADELILTRSTHPRAVPPEDLSAMVEERHCSSRVVPTVSEAMEYVLSTALPSDMVLICGSLFVVAQAREHWFVREGLPMPPKDPQGAY